MIKKTILILFLLLMPIISFAQTLDNPLAGTNGMSNEEAADPRVILGNSIKGALSILGALALAVFMYGGFLWMLSWGNQERITKGKNVLIWAFLGLLVIFSSYAVVNYMLGDGFLSAFFFV